MIFIYSKTMCCTWFINQVHLIHSIRTLYKLWQKSYLAYLSMFSYFKYLIYKIWSLLFCIEAIWEAVAYPRNPIQHKYVPFYLDESCYLIMYKSYINSIMCRIQIIPENDVFLCFQNQISILWDCETNNIVIIHVY